MSGFRRIYGSNADGLRDYSEISIVVFIIFSVLYLNEKPRWNEVVSFALIFAAVFIAMIGKPAASKNEPPTTTHQAP